MPGAPRGPQREPQTSDAWQGNAFFVQIERCMGIKDQVCSVRIPEEKYVNCSELVKHGVERLFDGQLRVDIVDVATLYALEIRVVPEGGSRHGRRQTGDQAKAAGAFTVFSKIQSKRWPKVDDVVASIQDFCRVPVQLLFTGRELKADATPAVPRQPLPVASAVNKALTGEAGEPAGRDISAMYACPLAHSTFLIAHNDGGTKEIHTNQEGVAEVVLFPGNFCISCEQDSKYDCLEPGRISVPARFAALEQTIIAAMKKQCTFLVVDHLNRPFGRFPLKFAPNLPGAQVIHLQTKVNGRCRARLGRGVYRVAYDAAEGEPTEMWPVAPTNIELEVQDVEVPQFFRVCVFRIRFPCNIILRTRFEELVKLCPFSVTGPSGTIQRGVTSDIGVASCDLPVGTFTLKLEVPDRLPYVSTELSVVVGPDGECSPHEACIETKTVPVVVRLVTPDGRAAPLCPFTLAPQFGGSGPGHGSLEALLQTDENGVACSDICLLEPYVFRVKDTGRATEYMPQEFLFVADRPHISAVVARRVLGVLAERRVALVVDASGSMGAYIADVKTALNLALVQQFHRSDKLFNIVTYTGYQAEFRSGLVDCRAQNIEDAMRFCECIQPGGRSNMVEAIRHITRMRDVEAAYLITDGKLDGRDALETVATKVAAICRAQAQCPRINIVGINCVPERLTYRTLKGLAALTKAEFRPVCLEQDEPEHLSEMLAGPAFQKDGHLGLDAFASTEEEGSSADAGLTE